MGGGAAAQCASAGGPFEELSYEGEQRNGTISEM